MRGIEPRIAVKAVRRYPENEHLLWRKLEWALLEDGTMLRRESFKERGARGRTVMGDWVRRGLLKQERWQFVNFWMESGFHVTKGPAYVESEFTREGAA